MNLKQLIKRTKIQGTVKGHSVHITWPNSYEFYHVFLDLKYIGRVANAGDALELVKKRLL